MLGWEDVANSLWGIKTSWRKGVAPRQMEDVCEAVVCEAVLFGRGRRKTCLLFNKKNFKMGFWLFSCLLLLCVIFSWSAELLTGNDCFIPEEYQGNYLMLGYFQKQLGKEQGQGVEKRMEWGKKKKTTHIPWWLRQYRLWLQCRRCGFDPSVRKIPWRSKGQPIPGFLPGEFHGQRSLVGNSPWVAKSQTWLSN